MLIPATAKWGPFNLHGIVLMAMYLLGFGAALASAFLFKLFIKNPVRNYFMMELPGYKLPVWSNILITLYDKGKAFVWGAGKIIVAVSVILWALASFGPSKKMEQVEEKYAQITPADSLHAQQLNTLKASEKLQVSYAGEFGKWIEPAIQPLGFDWKIGVALLTSLAAREVFVGTMSTIYSVGGEIEDLSSIREKMMEEKNEDGSNKYSLATVLSLMIFYAFAMQCMSTVSIVREETQSIKWPVIQFVYMTALAYISSWLVYNIFS
jgi:ferrous iron transport protein B